MSELSNKPRIQKGAIISFDIYNPVAGIIRFQYNPDTLSRSVKARSGKVKGDKEKADSSSFGGAPIEEISLKIELDATDANLAEKNNKITHDYGIYPQLSALEMLLYPKTLEVLSNDILAKAGTMEVVSSKIPFTLFIWGIKRVLPVRLSSLSIEEQAYDDLLNPIRATVSLTLEVLSYNDFSSKHPGFWTFMTHQVMKETMATISGLNTLAAGGV